MARKRKQKRHCYFCVNNIPFIDYKDADTLEKFTSSFKKIGQRKRTGLCAMHQRKAARAIKQARIAGLLPFVPR